METSLPAAGQPAAPAGPAQRAGPAERAYHRRIRAWSLYDVADHAVITSTAAAFFPPYFIAIAAPSLLLAGQVATDTKAMDLARDTASNYYAFAVSLAFIIVALVAPVVGTYADITGWRKRILVLCTIVGGALASLMVVLTTGQWVLALVLLIGVQIALNIALGLNSSLLPHITRPDDMNRASSLGYAMGYFGGGVLLAANTALFLSAKSLGLDSGTAVRIVFLGVGIWWIAFMIPMALGVPEPPAVPLAQGSRGNALLDTFTRLGHTLRDIQRYRELFRMLVAFWLYSEGIGAIIVLATAFGAAKGLSTGALIGALLMTQFVAFPYALIYGRIPNPSSRSRSAFVSMLIWTAVTLPLLGAYANLNGSVSVPLTFALLAGDQILGVLFSWLIGRRLFERFTHGLDAKRAIILGLVIYTIVPIWGFFLNTVAEFFMLAWLVGTVQGGTQALSRAIYADMSPRAKSGEFFGLYGLFEKFSAILGPLLYGIIGQLTHDPRTSLFSIVVFFLAGLLVLRRVDVAQGTQVAQAEEAAIAAARVAD